MSSRKAEQRRIKEEKQGAARRREQLLGRLLKVGVGLAALLIIVVLVQGLGSSAQAPAPAVVAASDHVRGNPGAPVTLTVYGDFQCPACRIGEDLIANSWRQIGDRVQLVFRHYPLGQHRHAFLAARYAEAAARQGRFWEMHDQLYAQQDMWSTLPSVDNVFSGYARDLGLDMDQFAADLDSTAIRDKIVTDQRGGTRAGVRGTPSFFINGRLIPTPRTVPELVTLVNQAQGN
ncbi:MAG TPA: thioredoxin domain-containing protein [Hyphomicrobiales bacterium]|nr:thioredoxin domain-containing protein [Hyphomicrobiales bacterium]